jgi:plastocyanin
MPDLPEDLAALLRARAAEAPEPPAPGDALLRTVRRRQAVRAGTAVVAAAASVVAVVAVAAYAVRPAHTAQPAATLSPDPSSSPSDDRYEFCTGAATTDVDVSVHPTELKFESGCYRVRAGAGGVTFTNPQAVPHNLVITSEGGEPVFRIEPITAKHGEVAAVTADLVEPFQAGDYTLTCTVHPQMHAQLVVR